VSWCHQAPKIPCHQAEKFTAIAEIELQHTRERQAAGITAAKVKGIYTGRAKGATKAKPRRAKELREQGLTAPEIAQILNVSERTVWRYLTGQ
jgi:DNA invertase Pin-like site-specific DNA recombinase